MPRQKLHKRFIWFSQSGEPSSHENTIRISWDISSLYTNIDQDLGITAVRYFLTNFPSTTCPLPIEFIIDAIIIILQGNVFTYDKNYYKQITGVAMGTNFAPTYAILAVGYLETMLFQKCRRFFGSEIGEYIENNFVRYIDDCFLKWDASFGAHTAITDLLNTLNPSITYTETINNKSL